MCLFVECVDGLVLFVGYLYGVIVVSVVGIVVNVCGFVFVVGYVFEEGESVDELYWRFFDVDVVLFF